MSWIINIFKLSKQSESKFLHFFIKNLFYTLKGYRLKAHHLTEIKYLKNIVTNGNVRIGIDYFGFSSKYDRSFLNIRGKLIFNGNFSVGKGCRFDVGPEAIVEIGANGYMSPNSWFLITHGLTIGDGCMISWGCQFLDDDFHTLEYENQKKQVTNKINIGNHVWIGCNSYIYKGVSIPNGCVIASNSVVKSSFYEENTLIAGNPAVVIKRNINWNN